MKAVSLPGVRVGSPREPSGLFTASQEQVLPAGEGRDDQGRASRAQAETAPTDRPTLPAGSARVDVAPTCSVREGVARFLLFPEHFVNVPVIEWIIL